MARVSSVSFMLDGTVGIVSIVADMDEYEYILSQEAPKGLAFPVVFEYTSQETAALFHRCGDVPGTNPYARVSTEIFNALSTVVDRLIEYEL